MAVFQAVLPHYRVPLFNELAAGHAGIFEVFTEAPSSKSAIIDGTSSLDPTVLRKARTYRLGPISVAPRALAEVVFGQPDLVILPWNVRQLELLPCLLVARVRRIPIVLWGHGVGRSRSRLAMSLRSLQVRLCAHVVLYSVAGEREVRKLGEETPTTVVPNTTGRPTPNSSDLLQLPTRTIGYIGRLDARKHLERLLEAVAMLRLEGLELGVKIVGDGAEQSNLRSQADKLGLGKALQMVVGSASWATTLAHLSQVDLVVFPEAGGLGVVDAFAAARAAIVLDSRAHNGPEADHVKHGITGFRYEVPTSRSLADSLMSAYQRPETLSGLSRNAAAYYRAHLAMDRATHEFHSVIMTAIASSETDSS